MGERQGEDARIVFAGLNEEDFGEEAWRWDSALVKVFEEGLTLTIHRYEDEAPQMRKVHMAQVHDEQNNKYRITGLPDMVEVGRTALEQTNFEKTRAIEWLILYHGQGNRTIARKWIDVAMALGEKEMEPVLEKLKAMDNVPPRYILSNDFLLASRMPPLTFWIG